MKTLVRYLIVVSLFFTTSLYTFSQERYSKVSIPVSTRDDVINIAKLGISLEGASPKIKDRVDIFVSDQEARLLQENGIGFTILIPDWQKYYDERQKMEIRSASELLQSSPVKNFHLGSMGGYLTYEELRAELDSMRIKFPSLISARDSIGASYEGRPLWAVRITKNSIPGSQPQALYMGAHHAGEPMGIMSLVYFMWFLLENYGSDPEVTMLLENRELWFIPLVNPDGYNYNQQIAPAGGGRWRKNRHPFPSCGASGNFGVDLERNYSFNWGLDNVGSSPLCNSGNYRGIAPFSEPETQAIRDFAKAHHFTTAHSFHAYGNFIISPWLYSNSQTSDSVLFRTLGHEMSVLNKYSFGAELLYPANGGSIDWMYGDTLSKPRIFPFVVEVGAEADGSWPPLSRILPLAIENVRTNLVLARAAGPNLRINKFEVHYEFNIDSVFISVPIINSGVGIPPNLIDVKISSTDLSIATTQFNSYDWNTLGPLKLSARKDKPVGTKVSMLFELKYKGETTFDTVTFRLGPAEVLYADNAEGTRSRWLSQSNSTVRWDTTDEQAHSGRLSFSESPDGVYANNLVSTFTLDSTLMLKGTAAELRFWLRGRSELEYDCLRAEISTNRGGTWISLAGRCTSPGSGVSTQSPFESPIIEGYKYEWVEEVMDLGEYIGNIVQIRFRFTSNVTEGYEGFCIDDISVVTYGSLSFAHSILINPFTPKIQKDTVRIRAIVENPFSHSLTVSAVTTDLASGKTQDSVLFKNDGLHSDGLANDNIWGTHIVPMFEGLYSVSVAVNDSASSTLWRGANVGSFASAGPIVCLGETSSVVPLWGKTVIFKFKISNEGTQSTVAGVRGIVRSLDTLAILTTGNSMTLGDLTAGQQKLSGGFGIKFSSAQLGKRIVPIEIAFSSSVSPIDYWRDTVFIKVDNSTNVDLNESIPLTFSLEQNFPNPFNPSTSIRYALPNNSKVKLSVYDLLGREIATLVNEEQSAGWKEVEWNASAFSSGIYFYKLAAGNYVGVKKMSMIK